MHEGPVPLDPSMHGEKAVGVFVGAGDCDVDVVVVGTGVGRVVGVSLGQLRHVVLILSQRLTLSSQYNPPGAQGRLSYSNPLEQLTKTWHPLHD